MVSVLLALSKPEFLQCAWALGQGRPAVPTPCSPGPSTSLQGPAAPGRGPRPLSRRPFWPDALTPGRAALFPGALTADTGQASSEGSLPVWVTAHGTSESLCAGMLRPRSLPMRP